MLASLGASSHSKGVLRPKMLDFPLHWMEGKERRSWWLLSQRFITASLISSLPSTGHPYYPQPPKGSSSFFNKNRGQEAGEPWLTPTFCNGAALAVS